MKGVVMLGRRYSVILVTALVGIGSAGMLACTQSQPPSGATPKDRPPEKPAPSRKNFERVEKGMTREQVAATVGGPPGFYGKGRLGSEVVTFPRGHGWSEYDSWITNDIELVVLFDKATGKAIDVQFFGVISVAEDAEPK